MAKRQSIKADPFDVWGWPPKSLVSGLSEKDMDDLRRYVRRTTRKVYRLAYDLGAARIDGEHLQEDGK